MRFVPIQSIREGTVLVKTIYAENGNILLREGTVLKQGYIKQLREYGINGLYIDDDISKDIEIVSTISESLKNEAVQRMKKAFTFVEKSKITPKEMMAQASEVSFLVEAVIDDILANKNFMINMIDLKVFDDYTFFHSVNVTTLSIIMGLNLGLNKKELTELGIASILHDIGKVFTPKEILNKEGKLDDREWTTMKNHSEDGYRYLKDKFSVPLKSYIGVLQHHERWDGTGYPKGAKSQEISLFARIITIADIYDALTSDRPYRKGLLPSEAMEYIMGGGGSFFDPNIVKIFVQCVAPYPDGTVVKLSNGTTGIVVKNVQGRGVRPVIKVFMDKDINVEPYILDLGSSETRTVTIVGIADI